MLQEEGDLTEQELDTLVATEAVNAPRFTHSASGGRERPSSSGANGAAADESSSLTGAGRASPGGGAKTGDGGPAPRGLVEVDLRQLDGVTYSKSEGKAPGGMLGRMLQELEGMELGKRVKKVGTAAPERGGGGGVGRPQKKMDWLVDGRGFGERSVCVVTSNRSFHSYSHPEHPTSALQMFSS